jgi:hypothetical protein
MPANSPPPATARYLDQERFQNAALSSGLQRKAFLAGPYIETEKKPRKSKRNIASLLRFDLYHRLSQEGWIVTLGEYNQLVDAAQPIYGDHNNSAVAEINHAKSKSLDAIVMLPSSPGSFLELGAFASIPDICRKMIVVVDGQYKTHVNYMNSGPIKWAISSGAKIEFEDYRDHDAIWSLVEPFVIDRAHLRALEGALS